MNRHWTVKLDDVAEINPRAPKNLADDDDVAFVPMSAVSEDGRLEEHGSRPYGEVKKGYTYFERGDILVAKITPCFENGKAALVDNLTEQVGFGSTEFHVLRPGPDLDGRYLFYMLWNEKFRASATGGMTGSAGQKRVPADLLRRTEIRLPPLDEQRRIAAILDKADALRQKRKRAIVLLDSMTQSIFLEMFSDANTLKKIALSKLGKVHTGKTPPTGNAELFVGTIPFITPGDLEVDRAPSRFVSTDGATYSKLVPPGSTLVCCIGATIGKMGIAQTQVSFNQQINAIEWSKEIIPLYGLQAMRQVRHEVIGRSISTTLPILKKSEFEKIEIVVAGLDRQAAFAENVEKLNLMTSAHKTQLSELDALFSSLQHRAFSGQL